MKTVCYHIRHLATGTTAGLGQITVIRAGRIVGATISTSGNGGGGIGLYSHTIQINNVAQADGDTHNPFRESIIASTRCCYGSGLGGQNVLPFVPLSIAVAPGDVLCMGAVQIGTAAASQQVEANVYVVEG